MTSLNARDKELVSLGAALGSNCVPCVEYHIAEGRRIGLSDSQILEAIRQADRVRTVPARKVLDVALQLLGEISVPATAPGHPCEAALTPETSAASTAMSTAPAGKTGGCGCG